MMRSKGAAFCASERRPPTAVIAPIQPCAAKPGSVLSTDPFCGPKLVGDASRRLPQITAVGMAPTLGTDPVGRRRPPTAGTGMNCPVLSTDPKATVTTPQCAGNQQRTCKFVPRLGADDMQPRPSSTRKRIPVAAAAEAGDRHLPESTTAGPERALCYQPGELLSKSASIGVASAAVAYSAPSGDGLLPNSRHVRTASGCSAMGTEHASPITLTIPAPPALANGVRKITPRSGLVSTESSTPTDTPLYSTSGNAPLFSEGNCAIVPPGLSDANVEAAGDGQCSSVIAKLQATMSLLKLGSPELPTVGSVGHSLGDCKPCAFVFKDGCQANVQCRFCHLCAVGEKKRRKREHKATKRASIAVVVTVEDRIQA